jgi:para-nitrobenzyl esterase
MIRIAGLIAAALLVAAPAYAQAPKVKTETGVVAGETNATAHVFRNIPFAAPPVGALRWAPPKRAAGWTGERDAVKAGPSCPQPMNANDTPNSGGANGPVSEDCLQLNVFAPKGAKAAPVMVWIHGGGHRTGAGWIYDGSNFARDGVVVVSINYRLGALGYFAHPALTKAARPGELLGNYGLMDQIAALQWVQRNIASFGGDPKNVTVFGESAGGMSILALLATPSAKGLYQKAVVQSGLGWFEPRTLADKEKEGVEALAKVGVAATARAADLRALPFEALVPVNANYAPFTDGRLMTRTASQAITHGHFADVPLIIGANSGEDSLMGPRVTPAQVAAIAPPIRAAYKTEAAAGDERLARAVFTDRVFAGPARWVAARTWGGKPSWLYHFSYVATRMRPGVTTAAHAAEIPYVWEYWGRRTPMSVVSEEDKAMAGLMHACWVSFAKTGAPKCGGQAWPAYHPSTDQLMEFGATSGVRVNFRKEQLDVQESLALPTLSLSN